MPVATLLAGLVTSCADSSLIHVLPPPGDGEGSLVFALWEPGGPRYFATDREQLAAQEVEFSAEHPIELYVYPQPLEALRIPAGPLHDSVNGTLLPAPARRRQLEVPDDGVPRWSEVEDSPLLDVIRIELESPCRSFEIRSLTMGHGRTVFLEPMKDGRLLHARLVYGWEETEFSAIDVEGELELLGTLREPIWSGARLGDDLYFGGSGGRVLRSSMSNPTRTSTLPAAPLGLEVRAISAQEVAGEIEIVAMSGSGALEHFDGREWSALREPPGLGDPDEGHLLSLGGGETLAVHPGRRVVTRIRERVLTDESLDASGGPFALAELRGETVVGLAEGASFTRRSNGRWERRPELPVRIELLAFLEIEGGYLTGGGDSTLVEWNDELGDFCEPLLIPGGGSLYFLRQVGGVTVASGRPVVGDSPLWVRFLSAAPL